MKGCWKQFDNMENKGGERIGFDGGVLTECKLKVAKFKPRH
jgi:hypothetical protein